jgi:hypothetical protein
MDQGLGPIKGSDLIRRIREMMTEDDDIVFVGNTGGGPEELNEASAIGNCDKGRSLDPIIRAFRRFEPK